MTRIDRMGPTGMTMPPFPIEGAVRDEECFYGFS
jgi:hypothetical protein